MSYATYAADPTNVVGRRVVAYIIDFLIVFIAALALLLPAWTSQAVTAPSGTIECGTSSSSDGRLRDDSVGTEVGTQLCLDDGDQVHYTPEDKANGFMALVYGAFFGAQALNLVVLQGLSGASVGKTMLGLRVVRSDGRKAGIGWAALRWVLLQVDALCCFLPGLVLVLTTKGHRRLGDMAASTYVVRKEQMNNPVVLPGDYGPTGTPMGGWGPASAPDGWAPPSAGSSSYPGTGSPWSPPADPSASATEGPTWDPARNAYIQYDRASEAWLQWDDAVSQWRPIDQ